MKTGKYKKLSKREHETLQLASDGYSMQEIAGKMFVEPSTIKNHLTHCREKLHARNTVAAVKIALLLGWIK